MNASDLDLVPTLELIEALSRRFDSAVIYGMRWPHANTTQAQTVYKYTGGAIMALGLTEMLKLHIAADMEVEHRPSDEL